MLIPSPRIITYTLLAGSYTLALSTFSFAELFKPQNALKNSPATIEADALEYDSIQEVVTAAGNVEVIQNKRKLNTTILQYDQKTNHIRAQGGARLYEPDGTILSADSASLQQDLTQGHMEHITVTFPDASHASAESATRLDTSRTKLFNGSYTSCTLCKNKEGEETSPLWKIRARETLFDEESQTVSYKHAWLELYGLPVAYTPYFSHPTPNADAKSGFLVPKYQSSSIFGTSLSTPYYVTLGSNKDITLTPTITTNLGPILDGNYRHLFETGNLELSGSITNPERVDDNGHKTGGHDLRGHLHGEGTFDLTPDWSWGFNATRSSDDTYLRKYSYSDEDTLRSTAYATYLDNRDFLTIESVAFQELQRTDDPGQTPFVLPHVQGEWQTDPGRYGDHFGVQTDVLSLSRDSGTSSHHVSSTGYWTLPYITSSGHVLEWKNSLRADGYAVERAVNLDHQEEFDGSTGRAIPQTELQWSYPLIAPRDNYRILISPMTDMILSPYGGNSFRIPNEDSQDIEFSDVNLFSDNHFTGIDRIEEGPRVNYGMKANLDHDRYGYTSLMLGQTYQAKPNHFFDQESGLGQHQSDIVGRAAYNYYHHFDIAYQFRLNHENWTSNHNFIHTTFNYNPVTFNLDYLSSHEVFDNITGTPEKRELLASGASLQLTDQWAIAGTGNRDIEESEWRSARGDLIYNGNCVKFTLTLNREFTRDRDIAPNTSLSFQISLKNLTD